MISLFQFTSPPTSHLLMSIHQTTIAEFMALSLPQLRLAVRLCDEELTALYDHAKQIGPRDEGYESALTDIATAITLRAVHKARLDELEAEEAAAAAETHGSTVAIAA